MPKATLFDRIQEGVREKQGRPIMQSKDEEYIIAERLILAVELPFIAAGPVCPLQILLVPGQTGENNKELATNW
jgi:hypothetical protein